MLGKGILNVCVHECVLSWLCTVGRASFGKHFFFFSVHSDVCVDLLVHLKGSLLTLAPHSVRAAFKRSASPESDAFQSLGTTCETQRCTERDIHKERTLSNDRLIAVDK